jgi:putative membrane protein
MRFVIKFALYFAALYVFMVVSWLPEATGNTLLIAAVVLALVNTLIRPMLSLIAVPFTLLTFGIASIFVNILTLVITNGIIGGTLDSTFWAKAAIAVVIMLIDGGVRHTRHIIKDTTVCC